jgi:hypothetical protein
MAKTICIYIPENDKKTQEAVKSINDRQLGISEVTRKLLCDFADHGFTHRPNAFEESEES